MRPPGVRPASFPPYICRIYTLQVLPAKPSGLCCLVHSPCFGMPYAIRVPQTGGLPTPSFRFHLTMDTLGVRLVVGVGRHRPHSGLSPPRYVPCPAHAESQTSSVWLDHFCNDICSTIFIIPAGNQIRCLFQRIRGIAHGHAGADVSEDRAIIVAVTEVGCF